MGRLTGTPNVVAMISSTAVSATSIRIGNNGLPADPQAMRMGASLVICTAVLTLLVYAGIALPAIWSASPARRKAAAAVLGQVLALIPATSRRTRDN
jgi:hypothetical protein